MNESSNWRPAKRSLSPRRVKTSPTRRHRMTTRPIDSDKNRSVIQWPAIQSSLLSPFFFFQLVKAHKLFLAMGSPVIEGLLFGGLAQANAQHQSSTMHSTQCCKPVRQRLAQGMYKSTVNLIRSVFQQLI